MASAVKVLVVLPIWKSVWSPSTASGALVLVMPIPTLSGSWPGMWTPIATPGTAKCSMRLVA